MATSLNPNVYEIAIGFLHKIRPVYSTPVMAYAHGIPTLANSLLNWCDAMRGATPEDDWAGPVGWQDLVEMVRQCALQTYRAHYLTPAATEDVALYLDASLWAQLGLISGPVLRHWRAPGRKWSPGVNAMATVTVAALHAVNTRLHTTNIAFVHAMTHGYTHTAAHATVPLLEEGKHGSAWCVRCVSCGPINTLPLTEYDTACTQAVTHQFCGVPAQLMV